MAPAKRGGSAPAPPPSVSLAAGADSTASNPAKATGAIAPVSTQEGVTCRLTVNQHRPETGMELVAYDPRELPPCHVGWTLNSEARLVWNDGVGNASSIQAMSAPTNVVALAPVKLGNIDLCHFGSFISETF